MAGVIFSTDITKKSSQKLLIFDNSIIPFFDYHLLSKGFLLEAKRNCPRDNNVLLLITIIIISDFHIMCNTHIH